MKRLVPFLLLTVTLVAQVEPNAGKWKTWVIKSGDQFRLPAPPDAAATKGEIAWLKDQLSQRDSYLAAQVTYWDAGSPGYRWMQFAGQELIRRGVAPTLVTRGMALVAAAIYDATVAAWDTKYAYNRPRPSVMDSSIQPLVSLPNSPSYPSEHAAAAGAASAVLIYLFPDSTDLYSGLAEEAARSRLYAGVQLPADTIGGLQLGRLVGAAVVARAKGDGSDAAFTGSFPGGPGLWGSATPTTPLAGTWQPWVLASGSDLRLSAPPPVASDAGLAEIAAVKNLARNNTTNHSAWFWQPSFMTPWLETTHKLISDYRLDLNPPRAARVYALEAIAQHDSTIACWDTKYTYLLPRPSQADPTVTTLFANPTHPSYPSGHACASGGPATILGYLFPAEASNLSDQATDAGFSTFYAGIHYQNDVNAGLSLSRAVGAKVIVWAQSDGAQ